MNGFSRLTLTFLFGAFLTLLASTAHAADCEPFEGRYEWDGDTGKRIGWYYVIAPKSNFVDGYYEIYIDDKCSEPPDKEDEDMSQKDYISAGAFAKNGRKAMKICELNMNETIAEVRRVNRDYFYCIVGERKGGKRQRREHLFAFKEEGGAKAARAYCKANNGNHIEPYPAHIKHHWHCYNTWKVSKKYLKQVGA